MLWLYFDCRPILELWIWAMPSLFCHGAYHCAGSIHPTVLEHTNTIMYHSLIQKFKIFYPSQKDVYHQHPPALSCPIQGSNRSIIPNVFRQAVPNEMSPMIWHFKISLNLIAKNWLLYKYNNCVQYYEKQQIHSLYLDYSWELRCSHHIHVLDRDLLFSGLRNKDFCKSEIQVNFRFVGLSLMPNSHCVGERGQRKLV